MHPTTVLETVLFLIIINLILYETYKSAKRRFYV